MRTTTAGELTVLAATTRTYTPRVKVENGSGTMIDLTSWVERVEWDQDIDQPVSAATVYFIRAGSSTLSLSPLRTDSTLNLKDDHVTVSAQLDVGRRVTIECATTAVGAAVVAGDYKLMFDGTIDVTNFEDTPVSVSCRDGGGLLVDRWVGAGYPGYQSYTVYGTTVGRAIESVMQDILDAWVGAGVLIVGTSVPTTLNVPVSPVFLVTSYKQQNMSVMEALQALAAMIGWDVRFKYDEASSSFKLTLTQPDRTKVVPDYTFGPSQYFSVNRLNIDRTNVRNFITIRYYKADLTPGTRTVERLGDATSQARYGLRYMEIEEPDDSPVNTSAEAVSLITAVLADLKDPKAEQEIELDFFWPADLGDLYRHSANSIHYNSNQDYAVVRVEHSFSAGSYRTRLKTRGSPAGAHENWLQPPISKAKFMPRIITTTGTVLLDAEDSTIKSLLTTSQSTTFNPQGSVIPTPVDKSLFSFSSGGATTGQMWLSWTWSAFTIYRPDGTTISAIASASLATPPSPTLTQVTSGALAGRTRFVRIGYIKNQMIMRVGAEASLAITINKLLKVTSPVAVTGYDGWVPLVGSLTNTEFTQSSALPSAAVAFGTDWTEPVGGADISGQTPYNSAWLTAATATGLNAGTPFFYYAWWEIAASCVAFADRGQTVQVASSAAAQSLDGRIALTTTGMTGTSAAAGGSNSGANIGSGKFV